MTHGTSLLPVPQSPVPIKPVVLVVDDSKAQRRILAMMLGRWGYEVIEAGSGEEALAMCQQRTFDLVLSDWMMPGMTGLDFCREFRTLPGEAYGYFILLTSKSEKAEIADGLEGGADDFLAKPVNPDELRARIRAGERIIGMHGELIEKNRLVRSTLEQLQMVYDSLDRDLIEARKLQQTLVRDRFRDFGPAKVSLLLRPSGHVGGDLVGSFVINPTRIAVYSVDVSGHGVASAMLTARLAGLLSGNSPDQNIALRHRRDKQRHAYSPVEVAERLNRVMIEDLQVDQYFTMAYTELDLVTGEFQLVQAGHPFPVIMRADGSMETAGEGGFPIGLFDGAVYTQVSGRLLPGDRLLLLSDGVTECPDPVGEELGTDGLMTMLARYRDLQSLKLLEALVWGLSEYTAGQDFPDDVSGVVIDYLGK